MFCSNGNEVLLEVHKEMASIRALEEVPYVLGAVLA